MANKIKNNLTYVFSAGLGLLNFILLAIPYVAVFSKLNYGGYGGSNSHSEGISGYNTMNLWKYNSIALELKNETMPSLLQILIFVLGICLLAYGVCGLLKAFGVFEKFPDKLGKIETKKLGEFGLYGFAGLNVLLLIFLIVFAATNTYSESEMGISASRGFRMSAGIFITLIFAIGAVVALKILQKKFPAGAADEPQVTYTCSKCGKKARAKDKFCNACGGEIIKKTENPKSDVTMTVKGESSIDDVIPKG